MKNDSKAKQRETEAPNVWIVPLPFVSHVICHLQFAKQLAAHGLTVTFFITEEDRQTLLAGQSGSDSLESWKLQGVDIRLRTFHVPTFSFAHEINAVQDCNRVMSQIGDVFEETLKKELRSESKPTCLISDLWLPRIRDLATELGIPAWVFSSFSSFYVSAVIYISQLSSKGILQLPGSPLNKESKEEVISLPGLPVVHINDIHALYFKNHTLYEHSSQNGPSLQKSEVIILSSFQELECRPVRELKRLCKALSMTNGRKMPHIWTIGPTFPMTSNTSRTESDTAQIDSEQRDPILQFLDSQPASSVLYVAFGSAVQHSREQIDEIIYGLENSQQPFLCVLHPPRVASGHQCKNIFSVIPPDYLARTKARGMFVQKWAPQLKILSHPSTGGFLTHCGQNSAVESLSNGVPLLVWPFSSDQYMNTRYYVDEAEVALEVFREARKSIVGRKEVERTVRALFQSDEGAAVRKRALQMREYARQSNGESGSSTRNIQDLVALIEGLQV